MKLTIEIDREEDGRWIAEVPAAPGALAYGDTWYLAVKKAIEISLSVGLLDPDGNELVDSDGGEYLSWLSVPGVDAVFVFDFGKHVHVLVREHGDADWEALLEIERNLGEDVRISVHAHQGRDLARLMFSKCRRVVP